MQISLTKKLADAMELKLPGSNEEGNPLFSWTANWSNVWDNRRTEDMLVLVNNATRFTVAIYQVKRKDLKRAPEMIVEGIRNTLLAMNLNTEMVEEYMRLAGNIQFTQNKDRQRAAWVSRAGLDCAFFVGNEYNGIAKMYKDTVGVPVNYGIVNVSGNGDEAFYPYQAMIHALSELTGMRPYDYRAFELLVSLDLDVYKAERRIIVPSNIELSKLHRILQSVFDWKNYHLYQFDILDHNQNKPIVRVVPFEEMLDYDKNAILIEEHRLSEFLTEHTSMIYTYDFGDHWQHEIELVRVIENHDQESPYLLEAIGQTPPEDVGGVGGFINFHEIMLNSNDPDHQDMKEWAGFWTMELSEWDSQPRVIRI